MNSLEGRSEIPPSATDQLERLCKLLDQSLPALGGVILHGSAASSGFEPDRSDLDVLAIVNAVPEHHELARVGKGVLLISQDPHPLEFSIVCRSALESWQHPCPHVFHFGEDHRERFESAQFLPLSPTDSDLAMHIVVARARGRDLSEYVYANACRTLAYLRDDVILSKSEGLQWCEERQLATANLIDRVFSELRIAV